jgi:hypothetical protein
VHGAWCMVHVACCIMHGAWFMVHGAWCMVHGAWCMIANVFTLKFENANMDYAGHKFYKNFALYYLVFIVIFAAKHWTLDILAAPKTETDRY